MRLPGPSGRSTMRFGKALQAGLTLVELMVAVALALAVIAGVGYIYVTGKAGFRAQDSQSRLQETFRIFYTILSRDIMSAGHFGCLKSHVHTNLGQSNIRITASQPILTDDISWLELDKNQAAGRREFDPGVVIRSYPSGDPAWPVPASVKSAQLPGTDALLIIKGGDDFRHLTGPITDDEDAEFRVDSPLPGLTRGTPLMVISNCSVGEIIKPSVLDAGLRFSVNNALNRNTASGSADPYSQEDKLRLARQYNERSMVTEFAPVMYYLANSPGRDGAMVPTLFELPVVRSDNINENGKWGRPRPVLGGVEDLQIRFLRAGSSAQETASQINSANAWREVTAVVVDYSIATEDDGVTTEPRSAVVRGTTVSDRRLRIQGSFTVHLRNPRV